MIRFNYKKLFQTFLKYAALWLAWSAFVSSKEIQIIKTKTKTITGTVTGTGTGTGTISIEIYNETFPSETKSCMEVEKDVRSVLLLLKEGVVNEVKLMPDLRQDIVLKCPFMVNSNYSWYFNNKQLTNADNADNADNDRVNGTTLTIKSFNIDQVPGLYACVAGMDNGKWANVSLSLCRHDETSSKLMTRASHRTVLLNENVDFQCDGITQSEANSFRIVWLKHYEPLNWTLGNIFNSTDNPNIWRLPTSRIQPRLLRLGSVQPEDEGWYTCLIGTSSPLSFGGMPAFMVTDTSSVYLRISNDIQSTSPRDANVSFNPKRDSVNQASVNSSALDADKDRKVLRKKPEITDGPGIEENNSGGGGSATGGGGAGGGGGGAGGGRPQFKNTKKLEDNIHKPSGSSVQLMCPATGNPMPNITWTRNNSEIERTMGRVSYKKWSIQMDDATTEDSGIYKCTICNVHGCIEHLTKVTIRDRLRSPPIISDKFPQNQTVLVNNSTYLECRVVSDLEPSIKWFKYASKRNVTIKELEQTALKTVNKATNDHNFLFDSVVTLNPDPDRPNILNFTNVTYDDEGWYTCVASNTLGHSLASAYMRVVDKLITRDHGPLRGHPVWIIAVAVVVVLLFLLGTVFIIYVLRKLKHEKLLKQRIETVHQWTKRVIIYRPPSDDINGCGDLQMPVIKIEKQRTTFTTSSSSDPMQGGFNEYEFPLDSNWEIPRTQLIVGSVLGEGAFGRVVRAEATSLKGQQHNADTSAETTTVAVKMVKEEHTDADMTSLVHEMEVMKMIGKHINIINLLGCCSQNGPLWVIVEYAPHGNLKDFLKKHRHLAQNWDNLNRDIEFCKKLKDNSVDSEGGRVDENDSDGGEEEEEEESMIHLTEKHLISFAFQIARGMEYLASRRVLPDLILIKQQHLEEACNTTRPTLTLTDIAKYRKTYARFTNKEKCLTEPVLKRATLA